MVRTQRVYELKIKRDSALSLYSMSVCLFQHEILSLLLCAPFFLSLQTSFFALVSIWSDMAILCVCVCVCTRAHLVVSDSLRPHGL